MSIIKHALKVMRKTGFSQVAYFQRTQLSGREVYYVPRLWEIAATKRPVAVRTEDLYLKQTSMDLEYGYDYDKADSDTKYPIIVLLPFMQILDGRHRLNKALLNGQQIVWVVYLTDEDVKPMVVRHFVTGVKINKSEYKRSFKLKLKLFPKVVKEFLNGLG
jgi:ribosome biogenesis protein Nip4